MRSATLIVLLASLLGGQAGAAEFIPLKIPEDADKAYEKNRQIGWGLGPKINRLTVINLGGRGAGRAHGGGPLSVNAKFQKRNVKTAKEWEKVRAELQKLLLDYFGEMPPRDAPLEVKVEQEEKDRKDHTFKVISIAFDKEHRGKIGLLIPKGIPKPGPAILLNDRWGGGIERASGWVYSRAMGTHFVREGFVVAIINHWDEKFGTSRKLCTAGAATHMVMRTVNYLQTLDDLVKPDQIGYWGHVYGADLIPFIASHERRLACWVASCTCHGMVRHYSAAFWSPPFWARQGQNMGIATRTAPKMYYSKRSVSTNPLPFLTQEMMAFPAPKPFLAVNPDNVRIFQSIRPVWKLYGQEKALEVIKHKWGTNQPVNAREYTIDFFLRSMCGVNPGHAPKETAEKIVAGLKSAKLEDKIRAAWQASWWRCEEATDLLAGYINHKDLVLRHTAAKALARIGAMKVMAPHLTHEDPVVRLAVVEMMQVHGNEDVFDKLAKNDQDGDRWVNEAKWQTLQVNPWE
jgi:hypothetical protein